MDLKDIVNQIWYFYFINYIITSMAKQGWGFSNNSAKLNTNK